MPSARWTGARTLIEPAERIDRGRLLLPSSAVLGAALNAEVVRRHGRVWTPIVML